MILKLSHEIQLPSLKVLAVAFSQDEKICAAGDRDGFIHLIDTESGEVVRKLKQHVEFVYTLTFHPDNGNLLSAGKDKSIREWDIEKGVMVKDHAGIFMSQSARTMGAQSFKPTTKSHKMTILSLDIIPGGKMATGSQDRNVKLWKNGEPIRTYDWHTGPVTCVRFQPNTQILFSASRDLTIRSWNEENGALIHKYNGHYAEIIGLEFIDENTFVSVDVAGYVILWDAEQESPLAFIYQASGRIQCAKLSYDKKILFLGYENGKIDALRIDGTQKIEKPDCTLQHHICEVRCICTASDGKIASCDNSGKVVIWRLEENA